MAENKTASLRKQLKIKTGVVKRWAHFFANDSDQIIQSFFPSLSEGVLIKLILPYLRSMHIPSC